MDQLLTRVDVPQCHHGKPVARRAQWYSWAPESSELINNSLKQLRKLPAPGCIWVRGCDPYPSTYSYRLSRLPESLLRFALQMGEALLQVRLGTELRFLTGMLDPPLTSSLLHKIFALIRAGIAHVNGDPRTSLDAPVKTKRLDDGFPLHSDLFLTDGLLLVFDNVRPGNSGKSLFLSRDVFERTVASINLIPAEQRRKLRSLMRDKVSIDSFDEWFDLVYSHDNPWRVPLGQNIRHASWAIKFQRGEGYLIHDRHWLHGRTAVSGGVTETRFRRLIYGRCVN